MHEIEQEHTRAIQIYQVIIIKSASLRFSLKIFTILEGSKYNI